MKKKPRYVMVDDGYGPAECWNRVKVVGKAMSKDLFGGPDKEQLLVERGGGERSWVAYWKECE